MQFKADGERQRSEVRSPHLWSDWRRSGGGADPPKGKRGVLFGEQGLSGEGTIFTPASQISGCVPSESRPCWCEDSDPRTADVSGLFPLRPLKHALVSRDYRITVFATCHAIRRNYAGPSASSEFTRPYLCRPWQRLVKHRLLCSREQTVVSEPGKGRGKEEERGHQVFGVQSTSSPFRAQRSSSFYVTDAGVQFV